MVEGPYSFWPAFLKIKSGIWGLMVSSVLRNKADTSSIMQYKQAGFWLASFFSAAGQWSQTIFTTKSSFKHCVQVYLEESVLFRMQSLATPNIYLFVICYFLCIYFFYLLIYQGQCSEAVHRVYGISSVHSLCIVFIEQTKQLECILVKALLVCSHLP